MLGKPVDIVVADRRGDCASTVDADKVDLATVRRTSFYPFRLLTERDAKNAVVASGGKVLGSARHPLNNSDFSSYLLQAQASGAKVVALANAGGDMINATKQANEFGLSGAGQRLSRCLFSSLISIA